MRHPLAGAPGSYKRPHPLTGAPINRWNRAFSAGPSSTLLLTTVTVVQKSTVQRLLGGDVWTSRWASSMVRVLAGSELRFTLDLHLSSEVRG